MFREVAQWAYSIAPFSSSFQNKIFGTGKYKFLYELLLAKLNPSIERYFICKCTNVF